MIKRSDTYMTFVAVFGIFFYSDHTLSAEVFTSFHSGGCSSLYGIRMVGTGAGDNDQGEEGECDGGAV